MLNAPDQRKRDTLSQPAILLFNPSDDFRDPIRFESVRQAVTTVMTRLPQQHKKNAIILGGGGFLEIADIETLYRGLRDEAAAAPAPAR